MKTLDVFIKNKLKINYSYKNSPSFLGNVILVWYFINTSLLESPNIGMMRYPMNGVK